MPEDELIESLKQQHEEQERAKEDEMIWDRINQSLYWFECQECDFKTDDYLEQYHHKAQTEHIVKTKGVDLKQVYALLK